MGRRVLLGIAFMIAAAGATLAQKGPAFRVAVDIVSLNVTVTDPMNRYVTDLTESEFIVLEDGVKQELSFFARRPQSLALSLLLDSSASMEHHLLTMQAAAKNFVRQLTPGDLAQVIDFDSRVEIRQPFTGNPLELEAAIGQLRAGGSTALHNAIYIALRELGRLRAASADDVRRKALIVFSDGEDTSSLVTFEEVFDLAKRSETVIYTIALRGDTPANERGAKEAEFNMRALAQQTGGRPFFPARIEDLDAVYAQIANELASQYTVAYASTNLRHDGAWRRVQVQVARPQLRPRTKGGYYARVNR